MNRVVRRGISPGSGYLHPTGVEKLTNRLVLFFPTFQEVRMIQITYLDIQSQMIIRDLATRVWNQLKTVILSRSGFDDLK